MDNFDKQTRSRIMSSIRSKNTKIELKVFKALRHEGINFKRHYKKAIGSPDVAVPLTKKVVFIDGCFWHGCRFSTWKKRLPSSFWVNKIERNIKRDLIYRRKLRKQGWKILKIWEHQLQKNFDKTIKKVLAFLSD